MRSQTFANTFSGGMIGDIDAHEQPNNTYRHAIGGRIVYNESTSEDRTLEENVTSGMTRAFATAKGNKFAVTLCENYRMIGSVETREGAAIFSTNGFFSEIGFLTVDDNVYRTGFAKYQTLFNDRNDPNGDRLNFDLDHFITSGYSVYENEFIERVYFTDAYNQKRVINLKLFYDNRGNPYHPQINSCFAPATYPKHISVHAFDDRMDLVFPKIKFARRIKGQIKSGMYQIMVKYVSKSGHSSVWSFLTRGVFCTTEKMDGDIAVGDRYYMNAYQENHHNRTMGVSGTMTEEGMRFTLSNIDTRWDEIKIGYVYHATDVAPEELNEYKTYDITSSTLIVDFVANTGIAIAQAEVRARYQTQLSVGTTAQQENRSFDANVELLPDMQLDNSAVKVEPVIRYYRPDHTGNPGFVQSFNPVSGRNDNDPATNTFPKTSAIEIQNFDGDVEQYEIFNDYENYKGQQFSHLMKGYFRGETYSFGLLFIDRKGMPLFVQHLSDYTFPEQYATKDANGNASDWTLSRLNADGVYDLRIMGAKISNISIPREKIYDKFGKLNISGFMIVRTKRVETTAAQGILVNCTITDNAKTETKNDLLIHPQEYWDNSYSLTPGNYYYSNTYLYVADDIFNGSNYKGFNNSEPAALYGIGSFAVFHSPDILIQQSLASQNINENQMIKGQLHKVGFVHKSHNERVRYFEEHFYSKTYRTQPLDWPLERERILNGRPKLGSKTRIKQAIVHNKDSLFTYEKFDPETADQIDYKVNNQVFLFNFRDVSKGTQQPYSVIVKMNDWKMVDSIEGPNSRVTYPIVNWKVTPDKYSNPGEETDSESSLDTRRYISTGHYQPITEAVLNKVKKTYKDSGSIDSYIFDGIELWGGDCYVNLFDFTRTYPEYTNCEKDRDNKYPDYSISMICPIESKYNLSLLSGRRFAANGAYPQQVSCGAANNRNALSNGISARQPEDWSYNRVLLMEESIMYYFPKPSNDVKIVTKQDSTITWSPKKLYGELEDSYRQKLVNDFIDVDGSFGPIKMLTHGFDYLYVIQEKAFGSCLTRSDRFVPTDAGDISVSSGSVIGGIRYISKEYGTQHPNSVKNYNNRVMFTDARKGKILIFSQSGVGAASDDDLLHDPIAMKSIYLDEPITHKNGKFIDIIGGIDKENEDFLTTMLFDGIKKDNIPGNMDRSDEVKSFTVAFSAKLNKWHSYHHFKPHNYFNVNRFLFSSNPANPRELYVHNHGKYGQWYGNFFPTILEFIVNPSASSAKTFDNAVINVNEDAYERIKSVICTVNKNVHKLILSALPYPASGRIQINEDFVIFMEDSLRFPLYEELPYNQPEKDRLRGHFMKVRIEIDNRQQEVDGIDKQCAISTFDTIFRVSNPNQFQ